MDGVAVGLGHGGSLLDDDRDAGAHEEEEEASASGDVFHGLLLGVDFVGEGVQDNVQRREGGDVVLLREGGNQAVGVAQGCRVVAVGGEEAATQVFGKLGEVGFGVVHGGSPKDVPEWHG